MIYVPFIIQSHLYIRPIEVFIRLDTSNRLDANRYIIKLRRHIWLQPSVTYDIQRNQNLIT
jgi:hypothetical protein